MQLRELARNQPVGLSNDIPFTVSPHCSHNVQVVCKDRHSEEEILANINDRKFFIEVTSIKGRKTRIEMKDKRTFLLTNLSPSTKYRVRIKEESDHMKR